MEKQKKQLFLLAGVLLIAIILWAVADHIPQQEEEETAASYQVTDLDSDSVTKLTYTNDSGTYSFTKNDDEWQYEADKTIDIEEATINSMISKLASYESENEITGVTDLSIYGLEEPVKTILLADGENSYTMLIGSYNQTTYTYYMCLEEDTSVVYTVTSTDISVFDYTVEDVLAEEETIEETTSEEVSDEETTKAAVSEEITVEATTEESTQ